MSNLNNSLFYLQNGEHLSKITLEYVHNNRKVLVDLTINKHLLSGEHFLSYQENGNKMTQRFTKYDVDMCHYHVCVLFYFFCAFNWIHFRRHVFFIY